MVDVLKQNEKNDDRVIVAKTGDTGFVMVNNRVVYKLSKGEKFVGFGEFVKTKPIETIKMPSLISKEEMPHEIQEETSHESQETMEIKSETSKSDIKKQKGLKKTIETLFVAAAISALSLTAPKIASASGYNNYYGQNPQTQVVNPNQQGNAALGVVEQDIPVTIKEAPTQTTQNTNNVVIPAAGAAVGAYIGSRIGQRFGNTGVGAAVGALFGGGIANEVGQNAGVQTVPGNEVIVNINGHLYTYVQQGAVHFSPGEKVVVTEINGVYHVYPAAQ